jgi:hypothetical protein
MAAIRRHETAPLDRQAKDLSSTAPSPATGPNANAGPSVGGQGRLHPGAAQARRANWSRYQAMKNTEKNTGGFTYADAPKTKPSGPSSCLGDFVANRL